MAAGLTLSELCALHFSRTLLESLAGTPFRDELESAFDKLGATLTPHMRRFLDQLPRVIASKPDPMRRRLGADAPSQQHIVARALEATLHQRQATLSYHSKSSERTKSYVVHPYRLAYAQGGLYLLAYVPEYHQVRTFAVERILEISLLEERFTPIEELPDEAFPHSMGVHSGPPERVEIEFQPAVTDYVKAREWHPSQKVKELPDGTLVMKLNVCLDQALQSWILSFGPFARVSAPEHLTQTIAAQLEEAHARYAGGSPGGQSPSG
jgi:predicted DNA-binding transcriptional regulator YafY